MKEMQKAGEFILSGLFVSALQAYQEARPALAKFITI
jgi:hypothetical protein